MSEIPNEPSELAMSYSVRLVAHETPIDLPADDLMQLTRWEARILEKTAKKNGYSYHCVPAANMHWLTRP
jgi:hypothetical protein